MAAVAEQARTTVAAGGGPPQPVGPGLAPAAPQPARTGGARAVRDPHRPAQPGRTALHPPHRPHQQPVQPEPERHDRCQRQDHADHAAGRRLLKLGETPVGPTLDLHHYFLGADNTGRDAASLLLYGGRASLQIGISSAVICCAVATIVALIAGFSAGLRDALSRMLDVIWAFPVILLAICISTELLTHTRHGDRAVRHPGIQPVGTDRHHRGHLRAVTRTGRCAARCCLVNKEFVEAAIATGASNFRLIFSEILPNVVSTVIVAAAADGPQYAHRQRRFRSLLAFSRPP